MPLTKGESAIAGILYSCIVSLSLQTVTPTACSATDSGSGRSTFSQSEAEPNSDMGDWSRTEKRGGQCGTAPQPNTPDIAQPTLSKVENLLLLIDASMAMRNKTGMEREHELTTAKRVVEQLVTYLPTRLSMGLRVFGLHHVGELEDGGVETSCTDTQLIVPIGKLNRAAIIRNVGILSPGGVAPLNYSLHKAIEEDLGALDTPSFLVAIVDGDEACSGDVKAYAEKLATAKHAAPIHVFVLVLNPARAPDDGLKLLAQNTRGRYYEGSEGANQMIAQLRNVFQAEFKPHARSPFWCPLCGQQSWQSRQ